MAKNEIILVQLSAPEAGLIYALRQHEFGTFTISKTNGEPYRVVRIEESKLISASDGLKLKFTGVMPE